MRLTVGRPLACLLVAIFVVRSSMAAVACRNVIPVDRSECRYGVVRYCNTLICAKGRGASCSISEYSPNQCGEGYFCLCGTCQGCSLLSLSDCFYRTTNCGGISN